MRIGESPRCTVVAHSRLKMRELRLEAARKRRHGLQVMTFEQLAARLTGGLLAELVLHDPIASVALIRTVLNTVAGGRGLR